MAKVHITNVVVLDNPSSFFNPFQFELTFECIEELKEDLEWKMIYVGSAESEEYDQVLDAIYVGPVPEGTHIFVFQADPPDVTKIPEQDAVGVTIILLTCSYRGQEFVRVGYFVNNDYAELEMRENPPPKPQFDKLIRNILASKPRVTRFKINWDEATITNGLINHHLDNMITEQTDQETHQIADNSTTPNALTIVNKLKDIPPMAAICLNGSTTENIQTTEDGNCTELLSNDSSGAMSIDNGATILTENSNSLAIEC